MKYSFQNRELFQILCGVADNRIAHLEQILTVRIVPRGQSFLIFSDSNKKRELVRNIFTKLTERFSRDPDFINELSDSDNLYLLLKNEVMDAETKNDSGQITKKNMEPDQLEKKIFTTFKGKSIYPRTQNQATFVVSIKNNPVTICTGPAGTGKTFLSIASACDMLQKGEIENIILTRPAVEAGESLGFLPGDLNQKVDPYLRPIYDSLNECLGQNKVVELIQARRIEIAPLAYMRGRTLNRAIIILDEAQNCTRNQLKMFLTRLGKKSHMCIGGDITQIDLSPGKSGLVETARLLAGIAGIKIIEFTREDIIRSPLVAEIIAVFENAGELSDIINGKIKNKLEGNEDHGK